MSATASHRPTIAVTKHAISAGHYLAATAGFNILQAGGNAIDAGCAAGIALGVLQSDLVDVAGVAPIMIYLADKQEVVTIAGLGPWPKALDPDLFMREHGGKIPKGVLRTVVPAAPDAWITALRRYGTMSFGDVAAAATRLARDGFPMYPLMAASLKRHEADHQAWSSTAEIFLPNGRVPETGEVFRQTDLASSLQYMADEERAAAHRGPNGRGREAGLEAARDAFYRGDIARKIVAFIKQEGGLLSAEDLAEYQSPVGPPGAAVSAISRSSLAAPGARDPFCCRPWRSGGVRSFRPGAQHGGLYPPHDRGAEARFRRPRGLLRRPAVVDVPLATLLSSEYAAERRQTQSRRSRHVRNAAAGDLGRAGARYRASLGDRQPPSPIPPMSASSTATATCSRRRRATAPRLAGCAGHGAHAVQRAARNRAPDPRHPSGVAPGKRPRLTPNRRWRSRPRCVPAVRHARRRRADPGDGAGPLEPVRVRQGLQSAIEAPRFATYSFPSSFAPYDYYPGRLALKSRIPEPVITELARRGHEIQRWPDWIWTAGAVCAILADRGRGVLEAGADPRRAAYAIGW